jgi:HAMP domain-containing protein
MGKDADRHKGDKHKGEKGGEVDNTAITIAKARTYGARVVWLICLVLALVLAVAAFSYALELNEENALVSRVRSLASAFDLGFFSLDNPIKEFTDDNESVALTKTALTQYGLGAIFYIVVGRLAERIIRP